MDSQKLYDDLEYFKSMALTAKNHTDKALQDCDFYRNEFLKYK
jgi:hypothetical protein